jgi:ankyrin repeat protein
VPWEPPGPQRLAMAEWMIAHGSDVHQGGDSPLMRAALVGHRIPMMELLVSHGADVNALWNGYYPIIFAPCKTVDPASLKWLLEHGASPNCADPRGDAIQRLGTCGGAIAGGSRGGPIGPREAPGAL